MIVDKNNNKRYSKTPFDGLVFFALTRWIVRPKYGVSS